jgi:hypothetical protein
VNRAQLTLPRSTKLADLNGIDVRRATEGAAACSDDTPINRWFLAPVLNTIAKDGDLFWMVYEDLAAADLPTYEAIVFESSATPQSFGYTGTFTKTMVKTERDVKGFWDIKSSDIQVVAMHGTVLFDEARVAATYEFVYGVPAPIAAQLASILHDALESSVTMKDGNYALWTFNSVSFRAPELGLPPKIVMGDGILEGYEAVGLGDVAPQAIFAHEYAHQIQFIKEWGLTGSNVTPAAATRYTELMADAMAGYYLTHSRGATMNRKRVEEFLNAFYQIGDCAVTDPGHHGTPTQRMASARFGFAVADEAQKQGHILSSDEFLARFNAAYGSILSARSF